jgi:hypothetical protein
MSRAHSGGAHASRVSGEHVLAIADFSSNALCGTQFASNEDCFGATPKPARETRALPNRIGRFRRDLFL